MAKKKVDAILELPGSWGNLNIGDETARLGATVARAALSVTQADKNLCCKRLAGTIIARAGDGNADQSSLPGADADETITAIFDVKSFGVSRKNISFGLTVSLGSIEIEVLAKFAKRQGQFWVQDISDIPEDEANGGDE